MRRIAKPCAGKEVSHQRTEEEMTRYGKDGARDTHRHPRSVRQAAQQVHDILRAGKTQRHARSIDDAVQLLVKERILLEQDIEHQQLSRLLGHGCRQEGL